MTNTRITGAGINDCNQTNSGLSDTTKKKLESLGINSSLYKTEADAQKAISDSQAKTASQKSVFANGKKSDNSKAGIFPAKQSEKNEDGLFSGLIDSAKEKTKNLKDKAANEASEIADSAAKTAKKVKEKTVSTAKKVANEAGEIANSTSKTVKNIANSAKEKAISAGKSIKQLPKELPKALEELENEREKTFNEFQDERYLNYLKGKGDAPSTLDEVVDWGRARLSAPQRVMKNKDSSLSKVNDCLNPMTLGSGKDFVNSIGKIADPKEKAGSGDAIAIATVLPLAKITKVVPGPVKGEVLKVSGEVIEKFKTEKKLTNELGDAFKGLKDKIKAYNLDKQAQARSVLNKKKFGTTTGGSKYSNKYNDLID